MIHWLQNFPNMLFFFFFFSHFVHKQKFTREIKTNIVPDIVLNFGKLQALTQMNPYHLHNTRLRFPTMCLLSSEKFTLIH